MDCIPGMSGAYAHDAKQSISLLCLVAALLATLSYTGVLTPPKPWSTCDTLCVSSMAELSVLNQEIAAYLRNSTLSSQNFAVSEYNTFSELTNLAAVNTYVTGEIEDAVQAGYPYFERDEHLTWPLEVFLVLNAIAFSSSMACLLIAGFRSAFANGSELATVETDCLLFVMLAGTSLFFAFIFANVEVFIFIVTEPGFPVVLMISGVFAVVIAVGIRKPLVPVLLFGVRIPAKLVRPFLPVNKALASSQKAEDEAPSAAAGQQPA